MCIRDSVTAEAGVVSLGPSARASTFRQCQTRAGRVPLSGRGLHARPPLGSLPARSVQGYPPRQHSALSPSR
eukprot:7329301-Alexandrium_andersonii.AAC.1